MSVFRYSVIFFAGLLFGSGLAFSGMTDPARVIGFLDIFGQWDPALLIVMACAVGTFAGLMYLFRKRRQGLGFFGTTLPAADSGPVDRRLLIGATLFGVGWGLGGFCPGPALANLGAFRIEAINFVLMMVIGMLLAQELFGADK
jgi:uncharacterized membrane protein YedE/YeeE